MKIGIMKAELVTAIRRNKKRPAVTSMVYNLDFSYVRELGRDQFLAWIERLNLNKASIELH